MMDVYKKLVEKLKYINPEDLQEEYQILKNETMLRKVL